MTVSTANRWPYLARLMGYGVHRLTHHVLGTAIAGRIPARQGLRPRR
jgi:hypothetical protein